jgi:hypothetical protein
MRINVIVTWDKAPASGKIAVIEGRLANGIISIGWGNYDSAKQQLAFTSTNELARMAFAVDSDANTPDQVKTLLELQDTSKPFSAQLRDILRAGKPQRLAEAGVEIAAEVDQWESLSSAAPRDPLVEVNPKMPLPLYKGFTPDQLKQFGGIRKRDTIRTERRAYSSPFMYENVKVGNFYEIDPTKGIELKSMDGFITIEEDRPIVGVTVVGSACVPYGFNVCEWWADGESIDNMKDQLVKRQRIDNLHGTHPSIYSQLMMGTFPGLTFASVTEGQMRSAAECLKKLTDGYYTGYFMGFYENVANFRPGPPYPNKVTIRAGTKLTEDAGTVHERYPGDYAVRVIEVSVMI